MTEEKKPVANRANDRVMVMGVGNTLLLDEGIGPAVIARLLEEYEFPENVEVTDSGTMGMWIMHMFQGVDYMIVIDAIQDPALKPGDVVSFPPKEIAPNTVLHGAHDMRFADVLEGAEMLGWAPEGECVGIQVENIAPEELSEGLTPAVEAAIPVAVEATITLLNEAGIEVKKKQ